MGRLRELLGGVLPENCFLAGLRINKNQRSFSLRLNPGAGDDAVGLNVDGFPGFAQGEPRCDGLFFCSSSARGKSLAVLVELKGTDVAHAPDQLFSTARKILDGTIACHNVKKAFRDAEIPEHGAGALGLIVSRTGMRLNQPEKVKKWTQHKVWLHIVTGDAPGMTLENVFRYAAFCNKAEKK